MTPERLELKQWVEKRLYDHYASQPDCDCMYCDWRRDYLLAVAEVETLHEQAKQGTLEADRQIDALTAEIDRLKGEVERLMANKWLFIPEEDVCKKCSGIGRRAYSSTATWRGGIGGQAITEDVCDSCWGTGRIDRKGFDIRKFGAEMKSLRTRLDALVTAGEKVVSREQHAIDGDTFPDDQLLDTVIELGDYRALSAALAAAVAEAKGKE